MAFIRKLTKRDRTAVLNHFNSLDSYALRSRFMHDISPALINKYVQKLDFDKGILLAIRENTGTISGLAEIYPVNEEIAEVAFSVLKSQRGKGLGAQLVKRTLLTARNNGYSEIQLNCLSSNTAMTRLAQNFEITLKHDFGDAEGHLQLPALDVLSVSSEISQDLASNTAYVSNKLIEYQTDSLFRLIYKPILNIINFASVMKFDYNLSLSSPEL